MKIFYSAGSPFVRKVMVVAHELGCADAIERLPSAAGPVKRDETIRAENPLGQVPTFITDGGEAIFDSRVICEYLDATRGDGSLFGAGSERWSRLTMAAAADGLAGAALLARYEGFLRPEDKRWPDWVEGQLAKVRDAIGWFETRADGLGDRFDIGTISFGCALAYVDFRFADLGWRDHSPEAAAWFARFSERPSMKATEPKG